MYTFAAPWAVNLQPVCDDPQDGAHAVLSVTVLKASASCNALLGEVYGT